MRKVRRKRESRCEILPRMRSKSRCCGNRQMRKMRSRRPRWIKVLPRMRSSSKHYLPQMQGNRQSRHEILPRMWSKNRIILDLWQTFSTIKTQAYPSAPTAARIWSTIRKWARCIVPIATRLALLRKDSVSGATTTRSSRTGRCSSTTTCTNAPTAAAILRLNRSTRPSNAPIAAQPTSSRSKISKV